MYFFYYYYSLQELNNDIPLHGGDVLLRDDEQELHDVGNEENDEEEPNAGVQGGAQDATHAIDAPAAGGAPAAPEQPANPVAESDSDDEV